MKILIIIPLILFSACSLFQKKNNRYPFGYKREVIKNDYIKHLSAIIDQHIGSNKNKILKLNTRDTSFLAVLMEKIHQNNEVILLPENTLALYVYDDKRAFYFSYPNGQIFISSGLFRKFLKNEDVLIALLTKEIAKSNLSIYHKQQLIPKNNYSIEEILKFTKLSLEENIELNNLTYEILKRSGFDPAAELLWIQIQNRNTTEFSLVYETPSDLGYEEYNLKNYIVQKGEELFEAEEKNSSKNFYRLKEKIESKYGK